MESSGAKEPARGGDGRSSRWWWSVVTAAVFIFVGFQCVVIAAALQGRWWLLLVPGGVCIWRAWESWKVVRRRLNGGSAGDADPPSW